MMVNTFPFCEESKLRDKVIWRCTSKKTNCKARIHMLGANVVAVKAFADIGEFRFNSSSKDPKEKIIAGGFTYLKDMEFPNGRTRWRCGHTTEAFFLPSRAGKSVLIFQSNKFWVNNQYREKLNWACRDKDTKGCLCRVQTTLEGRFIRVKGGHNHKPNFTPFNFDAPTPDKPVNDWNASVKST
ncbi:jg19956 [Pararge aegeria aegeria]|uniref:Jg19956 protein n=1 Tax=Pararge aegeria aegeria TaxID=348720 RepID=A0A8S4RUY9_9NEOP|nr:jg19956 [Pararge aegeria aegeria]